MWGKLKDKINRKLAYNTPDYTYDENLLRDYFDEACLIIKKWKKWSNTDKILSGDYDNQIIRYIIESINISGLEGQSSSSANGVTKTFRATPEANLKSSIPQSL